MSPGIGSGHCGGVRGNDARHSYGGRRRRGAHPRPGLLLRGLSLLALAPHGALAQVTFPSLMVQNKDDSPGSFVLADPMTIDTVEMAWRGGSLSQRDCSLIPPGYDCNSRWGNDFFGIIMMTLRLTDDAGTELLPGDPSNIVGFTPASSTLTGLRETDVVMTWVLDTPVDLPAGTYKIWDSDDLADYDESDNTGFAVYDVTLWPFTTTSSTTTTRSSTTSVTTASATSVTTTTLTSVTTETVSDTQTSVTSFPTQTTTPRYRPIEFNNIEVRNYDDSPGTLFLSDSMTIQRVVFTYVSGSFSFTCPPGLGVGGCSGRWGGSIFGSPLMTLRLTDQQNNELLPQGNVVGFSPPLGLTGLALLDDEMTWELMEPLYLDMGIYKIWDYMDLTDGMDNTGSVVYDISFVPFTTTTTTTSTETSTTTLTTTHTTTTLTSTTTSTTTLTSTTATSTTTMTSTLTSMTATSTTTITSTITSTTLTSTTGTSTTTMTSTTTATTATATSTTTMTATATTATATSTTTYTTTTATNTTSTGTTVTTTISSTTVSVTTLTNTTTSVTTTTSATTASNTTTTASTTWTTRTRTSTTASNTTTTTGTATTTETLTTSFTNATKRKRYVQVSESIADYYQATRYDENGTAIPRTSRCVQVPEATAQKFKARRCEESDT